MFRVRIVRQFMGVSELVGPYRLVVALKQALIKSQSAFGAERFPRQLTPATASELGGSFSNGQCP
jgi:hypothetical protein